MRELFVFPTETEHQGTCQLVRDTFPTAVLSPPHVDDDILVSLRIESLRPAPFIRWALEEHGGLQIVSFCYNLSLGLTSNPMPRWLVKEILSDERLVKIFGI